jgi:glycosyltransferase involved in cell wall biosynthesis
MLVGVDARHLAARRGVARHVRGMLSALDVPMRALVPGRGPIDAPAGVELVRTRLPSRAVHGAAALSGRPRIDRLLGGPDVVWLPAPAPVAAGGPYVLTVHDLSWEERPGDFTAYERLWHRLARPARLARRARVVVCVSAPVADAVRERWGVDVRVIEPGADTPPSGVVPRPGRYVLYVGALEPRKGLDVLGDAWSRAGLDAELLIAGEGRVRVPGATHLGHVPDPELHALYAGALALVLPSRLEGHGLPPREAAAHGTPSIVSDLPALRMPGTLRVAPGDAVALADALRRLPAERERLVAELSPPRPWSAAAAELRAVLEEAARP